ncbi:Tetratricopeptide-like helical [Penicillium vulpinum]|uniref:Protein kinase domain-containing protein n=1 Tax=Penicillium vulpinum TaxID=29845 RepID=A0A1V6RYM4_9EURO|nr:Tetratricopeptide-like helical [Penicillium vulpinum]KAJ5951483.1 Tetratricopeptide-like helical [Penicillium vulpinum]OQE06584.1 hypothetical protein PENVUL_c017G07395 [Penicillium vulpinum]
MARLPDLIRDSKLETYFLPDCSVETVHKFQESDPTSGQRLVTRLEHWQRQQRVGRGGFGSIWLEKLTKGGRPGGKAQYGALRAVKQIDIDTRLRPIDYDRELEAIAKFSHYRYERCFVKSFGWYEGPGQLFIAMEYLEFGDLFAYLHQKPPVPEEEAKEIAYQILDGLNMMHENGFAHRDLKPNNILIKSHPPGDKWWIKLADFGITKRIEESHGQSTTLKGTPRYFAPEIWGLAERGSAYATDIWALGEIVFEILTKKPAFATLGSLAGYKSQQEFPVTVLTDAGLSQPGIDFVVSLMCLNPNDRMTASSAMSSVWIQSLILQPSEPAKAIEDKPRIPSPVTIMTEEFASWTTVLSSEAPEGAFHSMSSANTAVEVVNAPPGKTIGTQKEKIYSSQETAVPEVMKGQGQIETLELRPTEPKSQHRTADWLRRQGRHKEAENMYRQALQEREKVLGHDHEETLDSTHWVGVSLYNRRQYKEAETVFRQALQGREKVLGYGHKDTLYSAHWLGYSLYAQGQYEEAAIMYRKALQGREKVLGHDNEETLKSEHWLGLSLHRQGQYKEAETVLRQALQGREKVLGHDHEEALRSAHWLGHSLYNQGQYKEAETMFRKALQGREKVLGQDYKETLYSAHYLGLSLYRQKEYKKAITVFRRALQGREKTLGYDHEETLDSAYWLGLSQYYQKLYKEARSTFRRTLRGREKTLGHDHAATLNTRKHMEKANMQLTT